jgi:uncharacterized protein (TIGR02145 family)
MKYVLALSLMCMAANTNAQTVYGALAIDRNNGFYYGWAYDYASLTGAENRAIKECKAKGGNCQVVLTWEGKGCAVYRTVPGEKGTAYGWGVASTQGQADIIATREALKRSNGVQPSSYVWACNSVGDYKEIKNQAQAIQPNKNNPTDKEKEALAKSLKTVKIGSQMWTAQSLDVSTFQNGDPIPLAKNDAEWVAAGKAGRPMSRYLSDSKENGRLYGRIYNWFAVNDPRGLAPYGFHIPDKGEWESLISRMGDPSTAAAKLKSKTGWKEKSGTDDYGFNALPGGNAASWGGFYGIAGVANFWCASSTDENKAYCVSLYGHAQYINGVEPYPKTAGQYVRCVKD